MKPAPAYSLCPVEGHGALLLMRDGRLYCPHVAHDNERLKPAKKAQP